MMGVITLQELADAKIDAKDLGDALNDKKIITPRLGDQFESLPLAIQKVIETGGFEPFLTQVQLLASTPVLEKKAAKALDTKKIWLWEDGAWTDTGLSELDQAKDYANDTINNERNQRESLIATNEEDESLLISDKNGIVYAEISSKHLEIIDLFGFYTIDGNNVVLQDENGISIVLNNLFSNEADSEIDITRPLFSKQLSGFYDEPILINVSSLFADRVEVQQENRVLAHIGSTSTVQAQPYFQSSREILNVDVSKLGNTAQLVLRDVKDLTKVTMLDLSVHSIENQTSKPINILQIGDSITNYQSGVFIRSALEKHGFTPTFIGTLKGTALGGLDNANSADGEFGEGRGGWCAYDFTFSTMRKSSVASGDEETYLARTQADKRTNFNPFVRPSISSDSSNIVRNGYVFDFGFYLSRFGYTEPDVVVVALGMNDLLSNSMSNLVSDYQVILSQILAATVNTKVVVTLPSASLLNEVFRANVSQAIRYIQQAINTVNSSRITLAPAWAVVSADFGFYPATPSFIDHVSGAKTASYVDSTHPIDATRAVIWSFVAAYIASAVV